MVIKVKYNKPIKIKIIMSLKWCVKKIIKINILNYFLINKRKESRNLTTHDNSKLFQ
jgi:hypothetical protein